MCLQIELVQPKGIVPTAIEEYVIFYSFTFVPTDEFIVLLSQSKTKHIYIMVTKPERGQ